MFSTERFPDLCYEYSEKTTQKLILSTERFPDVDPTPSASYPAASWVALGSPARWLGFSHDSKTFLEARAACGAGPGPVRLAVLDTLLAEVADWVLDHQPGSEFWVDASRPISHPGQAAV